MQALGIEKSPKMRFQVSQKGPTAGGVAGETYDKYSTANRMLSDNNGAIKSRKLDRCRE